MPNNRSQRHLIAALTEELRIERDHRMHFELECLKLRTENDVYKKQDQWQKQLIEKLTSEMGNGGAKHEEHPSATPPDFAGFIAAIETFAGKIESNSAAITRNLQVYQETITADKSASNAWSDKLDKFISALETAKSDTKAVRIAKSVSNTLIDLGVGYSGNLAATESSAYIHRKKGDPSTDSNQTNATLSTVASSLASATISHLPSPTTVVTSAASAVTAAATPAIVTAVAIAIAMILLTGVQSLALAGNVDTEQSDEQVEHGNVGGGSRRAEDEDTAKE